MRGRWLAGVALVAVVLSLAPLGGVVPGVSAAACSYANGTFTGDCYAVNDLGRAFACEVDYTRHTYTQGCFMTSFPPGEMARFSPVQDGPTCDQYLGGWFCPDNRPTLGQFNPPGARCTFDNLTNTNVWDCWSAGPSAGVKDCTIATSTGADVALNCAPLPGFVPCPTASPSPAPSASPSASPSPAPVPTTACPSPSPSAAPGAPPCGAGANLVCNGGFEDASGVAPGAYGGWRQVPTCDTTSYEQIADAYMGVGAGHLSYPTFDVGPCGNPNKKIEGIVQHFPVGRWGRRGTFIFLSG